mmetsp:Transcript_8217/g.23598  ORF Transcript_8217/g.23598 Transcript_8217/m.23598 type:complete len:202 (+) Transcript_8217:146-751(+)|eukprot:CAMPEP_0117674642 /NCGR_PEP_ID=MMETSP0804-20121206/15151_1 /TAXON_ID=1074897 /ORGANISM="Tetraselmis astigmatica, Strain CCMP880" /LENGTH=201 /DNA_ID=CAMNT_0005483533 /DNA_START=94 /DNA_END=699 /DNA_ORIENTATION=+
MKSLRGSRSGKGGGVSKRRAEAQVSDPEEVRKKCCSLLEQALAAGTEADWQGIPQVASGIEQELFDLNCSRVCREYKAAVRKLAFNLKENSELRGSVAGRTITVGELCRMQSFELATSKRQTETTALQARTLERSTLAEDKGIHTTAYRCPECGKNDTQYQVMAGRRDIGKSETWGSAESPAPGIQIHCMNCSHTWKRDMA